MLIQEYQKIFPATIGIVRLPTRYHFDNKFMLFAFCVLVSVTVGSWYFLRIHRPQAPVSVLAPHVIMGQIILRVNDLEDMKNFYTQMLGMQVVAKDTGDVSLGYNNQTTLQLVTAPTLRQSSTSDPGLDQIAIVFSSRPGLARALQRILSINPSVYKGGTSRGVVGEAFYVTDPQGNSLELYYDTDPSTWPRSIKGNVEGNALPIDSTTYISSYANKEGDSAMKLGHLQIRIGDISQGKEFYIDTIGFYTIPQIGMEQSIFMSDGFYHHDLVINQAQKYSGGMATSYQGLAGFSFFLPNITYLKQLESRLAAAHISYTQKDNTILFFDPWGIQLTVGVEPGWESWFGSILPNFFHAF